MDWPTRPAILERYAPNITVVRDDLLSEGGSKLRFLPFLVAGAHEVVFGGPFCGGAPLALAVLGRESGQRVTLFYAKRKQLHWRQARAQALGAQLREVAPGYMTNVQAKARAYAAQAGALFLPLGFDVPAAEAPFVEAMREVRKRVGDPDEVWCCAGSGMLARCLACAFPNSAIKAVAVGLASRHGAQPFPLNVSLLASDYDFAEQTRASCPFPSCGHYDRKAWELAIRQARGSALFWNVASDGRACVLLLTSMYSVQFEKCKVFARVLSEPELADLELLPPQAASTPGTVRRALPAAARRSRSRRVSTSVIRIPPWSRRRRWSPGSS